MISFASISSIPSAATGMFASQTLFAAGPGTIDPDKPGGATFTESEEAAPEQESEEEGLPAEE